MKGLAFLTTDIKKQNMSLLKNLFKSSSEEIPKEESRVNWIPIKTMEQLTEIKQISKSEAVAIFKHSTRCGISRMVIKLFEKRFDEELKDFKVYYLDLLNYREISNEVGYTFQVLHQSPQLLVIKNGEAVNFASHYEINSIDLKQYL